MGKTCKKCNKPNYFAKVCRSQVSKITEDSDKLEGECTLVVEQFGSCEESEIMPVQLVSGRKNLEVCKGENSRNKTDIKFGRSTNTEDRSP